MTSLNHILTVHFSMISKKSKDILPEDIWVRLGSDTVRHYMLVSQLQDGCCVPLTSPPRTKSCGLCSLFEITQDKIYYLVPTTPHSQCTSLLQHITKRRSNWRFLNRVLCVKINCGFYSLSNMIITYSIIIF